MYGANTINPMGFYNPYIQQIPQQQTARQEVVKVNGYNGASVYEIGANSSALLLDVSGLMVWLVTTDGAGYKTIQPYDISPHKEAPAPEYTALEQRIAKLEEMYKNGNTGNSGAARSSEAGGSGQLVVPVDE